MDTWRRRALSAGEIALARTVFGEAEIAWPQVRLFQAPALGFGAMAPFGKTIVFSVWRAWSDFAEAPLGEQGWLVHELMHIRQAAQGLFLPAAKLAALGKAAYAYTPAMGARLSDFNIERQAEIARHLFLARAGAPEAGAPPRDWLEHVWARRQSAR